VRERKRERERERQTDDAVGIAALASDWRRRRLSPQLSTLSLPPLLSLSFSPVPSKNRFQLPKTTRNHTTTKRMTAARSSRGSSAAPAAASA